MSINKNTLIKVMNKFSGSVGYDVPDLGVYRNFYPGETKEVPFEEIEKLSYSPGGLIILKEYLEIEDKEAANKIFNTEPQPEYFYSEKDIKQIMKNGSLDQFLDLLDFSPYGVQETIKDLAISLPLNDVAKRQAIKEKLNFDIDKAIEIKNTKYDGEEEPSNNNTKKAQRRTAPITTPTPTGRRYKPIEK